MAEAASINSLPRKVRESSEPCLLKGLASDWPLVQHARQSDEDAQRYILRFYQGKTVGMFRGEPGAGGRVFYDDGFEGFNFQRFVLKLDQLFSELRAASRDDQAPMFYLGSTSVDSHLPGFREHNDIAIDGAQPLVSFWLGNRTRVAPHHDVPSNLACCVAGRRRFTLFPPEQLENLYIGPLEKNPGGQAISLVDTENVDDECFPRFQQALENAIIFDLEPGDALFIPSLWWHQVEGLDDFNMLINYWWRETPAYLGSPADALEHAILALRELPAQQKSAWQEFFRYYVFEFDPQNVEHIPENARGMLGEMNDQIARQIRARLLNKLNR